jgi:hypothetical protein
MLLTGVVQLCTKFPHDVAPACCSEACTAEHQKGYTRIQGDLMNLLLTVFSGDTRRVSCKRLQRLGCCASGNHQHDH